MIYTVESGIQNPVSSIWQPVHSLQSIGSMPFLISHSFALEKCLQPKKPACAERGEGCAARSIKCLLSSIKILFSCANFPHNRNTTCFFSSDIFLITVSVNSAQPIFEWLIGSPARTVSDAFNKNTPCSAQVVRLPWFGTGTPISSCNSLKIFINEGGGGIPFCTEKHKPCACPCP